MSDTAKINLALSIISRRNTMFNPMNVARIFDIGEARAATYDGILKEAERVIAEAIEGKKNE